MHRRHIGLLIILLVLPACATRGQRSTDRGELQVLRHEGRDRTYLIRLPPGMAQRRTPVPLVLVLHGGGGNARNAEQMTGFTEKGRSEGFIVVYPEGSARGRARLLTWNAGHCCGFAMTERIDDVGFLRALIDQLATEYPVDRRRVYVTGMSNGAMMSHRIGYALADHVAAIAPVVGAVFGDEPTAPLKVSALMINGGQDRAVPEQGGQSGGRTGGSAWDGTPMLPGIEQGRYWAAVDGCSPDPVETTRNGVTHTQYRCPNGVGVERYLVHESGHAWPGGERGSPRADDPGNALDATSVIWNFFATHPKLNQ